MRPHLTLLLVIPLTGCAGLLIHPEDSATTKVAKVAARIPTALISLSLSEQMYFCARDLDHPAFRGDSDALMGWARLSPQERLSMCQTRSDWLGWSGRWGLEPYDGGAAEYYEPGGQQHGDEKLKRRVEEINREAEAWQKEQNRAAEADQKLQQHMRRFEEQQEMRERMQETQQKRMPR